MPLFFMQDLGLLVRAGVAQAAIPENFRVATFVISPRAQTFAQLANTLVSYGLQAPAKAGPS